MTYIPGHRIVAISTQPETTMTDEINRAIERFARDAAFAIVATAFVAFLLGFAAGTLV